MEKHSVLLKEKKISLAERHMFCLPQCKFHMYIMLKWEKKKKKKSVHCQSRGKGKVLGTSMIQWLRLELLLQRSQFWTLVTERIPLPAEWPKKLIKWVKTLLIKSIGNSEKLVTMPLPFFYQIVLDQSMKVAELRG